MDLTNCRLLDGLLLVGLGALAVGIIATWAAMAKDKTIIYTRPYKESDHDRT